MRRAVNLPGFESACNVVMSMGLKDTPSQLANEEVRGVYEHIMKRSVAAAAYARELAFRMVFQLPDTAFPAGLVHQIGRLVLLFDAPIACLDLWYDPRAATRDPKPPELADEKKRIDQNCVEVGVREAQGWDFPNLLVTACEAGVASRDMCGLSEVDGSLRTWQSVRWRSVRGLRMTCLEWVLRSPANTYIHDRHSG